MATYERASWVFQVIKNGLGSVFEVPPIIEEICIHEQLFI